MLPVELVLDAEPLHAVAQRKKSDADHLRRSGAVVARLLERVEYRLPLDRIEALLQRQPAQLGAVLRGRPRGEPQIARADHVAGRQRERALEYVLELADVSREIVARELGRGLGGELRRLGGAALALQYRGGERRDVLAHLAQARHLELDHVQPVIQILPEGAA